MTEPRLLHIPCEGPAGAHTLACWQWGAAQAPHVVVCVHGLTRQGRDFDVLAQALVARAPGALRVVCPDIAGRGHSEWLRDPAHYHVGTYAADMLTLMRALDEQAPVAWFDWVGTSMGGLIGMTVCGNPGLPLPAPVRRLVLNDVGPAMEWRALQRISGNLGRGERFDTLQHAADAMAVISQGFGVHTPEQWLALSLPMVRPLAQGGFRLHYDPAIAVPIKGMTEDQARQGEAGLWALYDHIRADTLVLRGSESDLLSHDNAVAMTRRGPKAGLVEFPHIGHAPTLITPGQVDAVASFLLRPQDCAHEVPGPRDT